MSTLSNIDKRRNRRNQTQQRALPLAAQRIRKRFALTASTAILISELAGFAGGDA